jgi:hypothetical protein
MGWIPGWDSVASAGWWSGFYFWLGIVALIGLGAFEVASHRYSDRKDELLAAEQEAALRPAIFDLGHGAPVVISGRFSPIDNAWRRHREQ